MAAAPTTPPKLASLFFTKSAPSIEEYLTSIDKRTARFETRVTNLEKANTCGEKDEDGTTACGVLIGEIHRMIDELTSRLSTQQGDIPSRIYTLHALLLRISDVQSKNMNKTLNQMNKNHKKNMRKFNQNHLPTRRRNQRSRRSKRTRRHS